MGTFAGERIEVERQGGDQGLAFAGAHLGDLALVQDEPADELNIVMALADGALGGLAHGGKGLGQEIVQRFLLDLLAFLFVLEVHPVHRLVAGGTRLF